MKEKFLDAGVLSNALLNDSLATFSRMQDAEHIVVSAMIGQFALSQSYVSKDCLLPVPVHSLRAGVFVSLNTLLGQ